jgi:hypothetical protein
MVLPNLTTMSAVKMNIPFSVLASKPSIPHGHLTSEDTNKSGYFNVSREK